MNDLDRKIFKIHNYIYANEGLNNSETLSEFLKIFYCKILDEKHDNSLSLLNDETDILNKVNELYSIFKTKMQNIVDKADKINLKDRTILFIISELKELKIDKISSDVKGHILQKIIDRSYRESRGQFFTPAPVVDFMVNMIAPQKGEIGGDPASGTGGFMFASLEYIAKNNKITKSDIKNIYFSDISHSLIRLIIMRMMFEYSVDCFNCSSEDSIAKDTTVQYDFILTNPPFGTQGKIDDALILSKYDLSFDGKKRLTSQVPDILFVEKVIKSLKYGGRAGIILPDGDFENPSLKYFRKYLVDNVQLDAIVSLPDGTFIPYGTGVKSSIIFFKKIKSDELIEKRKQNYKIFYAKINKLGYSFSKHSKELYTKDGKIDEDFSCIVQSYQKQIYDDNNYLVSINDIEKNNYILSEHFYSPKYTNLINNIKKKKYKKLKELVNFKNFKEHILPDKKYVYIEIGDVSPYTNEIINCTDLLGEDLPSRASYIIKKNNIILATAGNAIGTDKHAKAIVSELHDGCICTNGFIVLEAKEISPYFLINFLSSRYFLDQVLKYKYGTAIPCISKEDLGNILVPIPTAVEIEKIENRIKKAYELRKQANSLLLVA